MGHFILSAGLNIVGFCCQHDQITLGHAVSRTQQPDPKANPKALGLAAQPEPRRLDKKNQLIFFL